MNTVDVKVDDEELVKQGYNYAAMLIANRRSVGVIPYPLASAGMVGYCQALIDACVQQQTSRVRLFTEK